MAVHSSLLSTASCFFLWSIWTQCLSVTGYSDPFQSGHCCVSKMDFCGDLRQISNIRETCVSWEVDHVSQGPQKLLHLASMKYKIYASSKHSSSFTWPFLGARHTNTVSCMLTCYIWTYQHVRGAREPIKIFKYQLLPPHHSFTQGRMWFASVLNLVTAAIYSVEYLRHASLHVPVPSTAEMINLLHLIQLLATCVSQNCDYPSVKMPSSWCGCILNFEEVCHCGIYCTCKPWGTKHQTFINQRERVRDLDIVVWNQSLLVCKNVWVWIHMLARNDDSKR